MALLSGYPNLSKSNALFMTDPVTGQPEPRRRLIPIWFIVLVLIMLGVMSFGDRGLLRVLQTKRQIAELEAQIAELEATNTELRKEIEALNTDLRTIERIARRELGMVRPDEVVFQFPPDPAQPKNTDKTGNGADLDSPQPQR